jgi:hypothetical protein
MRVVFSAFKRIPATSLEVLRQRRLISKQEKPKMRWKRAKTTERVFALSVARLVQNWEN